jgi:hypothetical protein
MQAASDDSVVLFTGTVSGLTQNILSNRLNYLDTEETSVLDYYAIGAFFLIPRKTS